MPIEAQECWFDSRIARPAPTVSRQRLHRAFSTVAPTAERKGALCRSHGHAQNLSHVTGLERVIHKGPSTLGIDTIYKSRGQIPGVFPRECGVPEEFIAYIGSMVGRAIEYYVRFIS